MIGLILLGKIIYSSWSESNELPVRTRTHLGTGWSARDVKEEFFGVVRHGTEQLLIAHPSTGETGCFWRNPSINHTVIGSAATLLFEKLKVVLCFLFAVSLPVCWDRASRVFIVGFSILTWDLRSVSQVLWCCNKSCCPYLLGKGHSPHHALENLIQECAAKKFALVLHIFAEEPVFPDRSCLF